MPRVPRIKRAMPTTDAVRPVTPVHVFVEMIWHDGTREQIPARAIAWTRTDVEVEWTTPWGDLSTDWVSAGQVSRQPLAGR